MITIILVVVYKGGRMAMLGGIAILFLACQTAPTPQATLPTGHLAYIGGDGNIYVTTADRQTTIAVTDDATSSWEGAGLSYQRIAWSPKGQLA